MNKVYQIITDRILEKLEQGVIPWKQPWSTTFPKNIASGNDYRGINTMMLGMQGYGSPQWGTFKQIQQAGGSVQKGEKGTPIIFYSFHGQKTKTDKDGNKTSITTEREIPIMRYYTVFNLEQTDVTIEATGNDNKEIVQAQDIVEKYNGPEITVSQKAYYAKHMDIIGIPSMEQFESTEAYYEVLFHEIVHSTGHKNRLDRPLGNRFGGEPYSKEELIAEIGSSFLCHHARIENRLDSSAGYIQSWLKSLKNDPQMIIQASSKAQKAIEFIRAG